jgi:hypothetical protein
MALENNECKFCCNQVSLFLIFLLVLFGGSDSNLMSIDEKFWQRWCLTWQGGNTRSSLLLSVATRVPASGCVQDTTRDWRCDVCSASFQRCSPVTHRDVVVQIILLFAEICRINKYVRNTFVGRGHGNPVLLGSPIVFTYSAYIF